MFDLGWGEIAFWVILAIIVIGPKDIPKFVRTVGQVMGRMRRITNNLTASLRKIEQEVDIIDGTAEDKQRWTEFLPDHVKAIKNNIQPHQGAAANAEKYREYRSAVAQAKQEYNDSLKAAEPANGAASENG